MMILNMLALTGMSRDTFNTLSKRDQLKFLFDEDRQAKGMNGWTGADALRLAAFVGLRRLGVAPEVACDAVVHSRTDIDLVAREAAMPPRDVRCGVRYNSLGLLDYHGWKHPKADVDRVVGQAFVDLSECWADVKRGMDALGLAA